MDEFTNNVFVRNDMTTELTEEEMRRALFGRLEPSIPATAAHERNLGTDVTIAELPKLAKKKRILKGFTPRIRVTLRVGNEFEGEMHELIHEADTLSSLVAEQDATRKARKKFRFIEVISVVSV